MGANFSRVKTWISTEDVTYSDLNAEFDNVLNNLTAANVDDYSATVLQMQETTDPGEVGSESKATSVAGELQRLRFMLTEITGKDEWYESPIASLAGLANAVGTGLTDNRLVSGRMLSTSAQPAFLVPNGAAKTVKLDGTPTSFIYYIDGVEYTISTDVSLTGLTAAPSSNNTCLIDDANASAQYWTKYQGEDGTEIPVDNMGSEISALVGKLAGFKIGTEYFLAYVKSTTALSKARRGYFFDSSDGALPRVTYSNNDTITLMKLTWIFAKTDGTLTATYNNPVWSDDEPTSPAIGDYWFDISANTWKVYSVGSFSVANALLVGICLQDTTNCVAARSFEFFGNYDSMNTVEILFESNSQIKSRRIGSTINVHGNTIKFDYGLTTWDMTLDLDSGVTEAASTYYYFYITETGDKIISNKKPHDRREDLLGYYHPHQSWRCVGRAFNNASQNLIEVESYYRQHESRPFRSVAATDLIQPMDKFNLLSGASFSIFLPPLATVRGQEFTFKHGGTSLSQVYTLDAFSTETIEGSTTYALYTANETVTIVAGDSGWYVKNHITKTAPVSYSPTLGVGFGTPTNIAFEWYRDGGYMIINGYLKVGTVISSTTATIGLPSGATLDTNRTGAAQTRSFGRVSRSFSTGTSINSGVVGPWALIYYTATDSVMVSDVLDSDVVHYYAPQNVNTLWATGNPLVVDELKVPITGWQP